MRKVCCWVAACVFVCTPVMNAKSDKDAESGFRDSVVNKQLVLRNFSGEDKVHAEWTGTAVALDVPRWYTMGEVEVRSVKLKGQKLIIDCERHVLIRDENGQIKLYPIPTPIEIDVELGGADPGEVLPILKEALFYDTINDALTSLPKDVSAVVPARMDFIPGQKPDLSKPPCDCAADDRSACADEHRKVDGIVPPRFLKGKDPELTDEARKHNLDVHVDVALTVDTAGHPEHVWVVKPAGMGLDEEAAKAVLTYAFRPATCHDKPVSVYLNVDVRFQRY